MRSVLTILAASVCLCLLATLQGCVSTGFPERMGDSGYSTGPVSEPNFEERVRAAIPETEGALQLFGRGAWHGFVEHPRSIDWTEPYFLGVIVLADANILLLLWNESGGSYEIVEHVPYSAISFSPSSAEASGPLKVDMKGRVLSIHGVTFVPSKNTYLGFENSSGMRIDREKNRLARRLFEEKVEHTLAGDSGDPAPAGGNIQ